MTIPLGTYSFLPWLRQGLANQISGAFDGPRATMDVQLQIVGTKVDGDVLTSDLPPRHVALFGPGDLQGIEQRAIIRTEPRHWITNFEPNYVPAIEFYDEDLPWRYTPEPPDLATGRLRPWITLVVLAEGEFTEGTNLRDKPLPYVDVPSLDVFPDFTQLWAWAHVHLNRPLNPGNAITSDDMAAVIPQLRAALTENPDLGYSRIVSPRMLAEKTAYHAFLMPVYESGRRAGLGLDPGSAGATDSAWGTQARDQGSSFPYYFRWFFQTATAGDFESLVRLLKPKPADRRVGTRDMDVQSPGINIRGLDDLDLHGILKLGGALRVPRSSFVGDELTALLKYENWAQPFPRPIAIDLAKRINLADDYEQQAAAPANAAAGVMDPDHPAQPDPDPVITLPLYGRWHALTKRLRAEAAQPYNWIHELNLDPRFRVAAGFGTRVVQEGQEKYMDAAWDQIGDVLEANRRIRLGQLAIEVSFIWYDRHLRPLVAADPQKGMFLLAPLNKRIVAGGLTVHQQFTESLVAPTMTAGVMRRIIRPRGRLVRSLPAEGKTEPTRGLIVRVNEGTVSAAPPKVTPPAIVTPNKIADDIRTKDLPAFLASLLRRFPNNRFVKILLALLALLLRGRRGDAIRAGEQLREENLTPDAVDRLPKSPDFAISAIDSGVTPSRGNSDSAEAAKFKEALKGAFGMIDESVKAAAVPPKKTLDLAGLMTTTFASVHPHLTVPKRVLNGIFLPPHIKAEIGESFVEAMAYPVIDQPMYEPLKDISSELFLPNLNFIEQNSITLLETNQKFIEAYMVGLNHEFSRELLWREFPTDQRGSYFRQFWDVKSFFNSTTMDDETLKELLRDIPPIHRWSLASKLEDHDNRQTAGPAEEEIVVVIRGELLKRYPTAVIYAHRAVWQPKADGTPDNTKERRLADLAPSEEEKPPRDKVRTPLYDAKVDPDIYFFGFDLTIPEARGGTGANPADDPGWFIVIKERPGDPRFGLDVARGAGEPAPTLNTWDDLSWSDVRLNAKKILDVGGTIPTQMLHEPTGADSEKHPQWEDDRHVAWTNHMSAAEVAYVLFQAPVLVGIHASEMLPRPGATP